LSLKPNYWLNIGITFTQKYPSTYQRVISRKLYFLCTNVENETIDKSLSLINEDITNLSEEREVYVRIHIGVYDADKMIGNKVRYIHIKEKSPY